MNNGPKLFTNKPKKSQLKQSEPSSSSASMASSIQSSSGVVAPPPPSQPPKESFIRRYKFVWPLILAVNFAVGAYLFLGTKKKDGAEEASAINAPSAPLSSTAATATVPDKPSAPPPIIEPLKPHEPIPENEQRDLFKWILEEKRKVKPKNREEKKRIDEEKALLKQFIRAKELPSL